METFDYIVLGAGSAGCVLADKLSADPRCTVLVLEAGGSDRVPSIKVPIGYGMTFHDPLRNWRFLSEPDAGLGGRSSYFPRGKVLGGSSSINAMVYARGLPGDYDDWRDAGNPGWGWDDVRPVFRSFERVVGSDGSSSGDGPLSVEDREPEFHPLKRHFLDAAREAGFARTDLAGDDPDGVGPYRLTTRKGLRWSAADAFLRPAMRRSNLELRTNVLIDRIRFDGTRAVAVEARRGSQPVTFGCRGEIVLAAGAIGSPAILQRSGVGPAAVLAEHGIPAALVHDGVGGHLQDHLGINYYYRATEPTLNDVLGSWSGRIRAALRFALFRDGPLSLSVNQMGGLVRSRPDLPRPDMQLYFNPLSYTTSYADRRPLLKPDPWPGFILGFNACRPTSTGRIELAAREAGTAPRIHTGYLSTNHDVAEALAGARLVGRLQETPAMRALIDGAPAFDPARASDDAVIEDFRARSGTVYHPCGTCRMAPREVGGVVGPDLRVHGLDGLRVADASVFPNVTSANTNAPTLLVAHMAARAILGSRR